jgi:hypothetical protein
MSTDDFLSRWSRRKLEIRREEPAPAPADEPAQAPAEAPPGEPEITPEEIAALPPVEEITAETDITAFLRRGVPDFLKNAALRRVWSLDPAIRDYVSEAREYAYDWNVPGGVPGNGPILPTDDVGAMVARIFEGPPPARDVLSQMSEPELDPPAADSAGADEAPASDGASVPEEGEAQIAQAWPQDSVRLGGPELPPEAAEPVAEPAAEPLPDALPRRRHGGAIPV